MLTQYVRGFTGCSMETSRIIRVGARNYVTRIAAVSQEHVLVCARNHLIRIAAVSQKHVLVCARNYIVRIDKNIYWYVQHAQ